VLQQELQGEVDARSTEVCRNFFDITAMSTPGDTFDSNSGIKGSSLPYACIHARTHTRTYVLLQDEGNVALFLSG
jgi:hypothetical protein